MNRCDSILFVMAAEQEYGPHLAALFTPLLTGVGPVEAAVVLGAELARREAAGRLPKVIVSLGSAGSRTLEQTAVYQVSSVSYRDMDASAIGIPRGHTHFLDLPEILPMPMTVPCLASASLSTGANIVSGDAYDAIEAEMVDMETYAHLRAAMRFGVPLIGLRGISDGAEELRHVDDWTSFLHVIDENL